MALYFYAQNNLTAASIMTDNITNNDNPEIGGYMNQYGGINVYNF